MEHLKAVLVSRWEQISQDLIDQAQFQKRLSLVTAARCGHVNSAFTVMILYISVVQVVQIVGWVAQW